MRTTPYSRPACQLTANGHKVSIVQNPTLSLEGDADATRRVLDDQDGPVVLVGHSYGTAVITEAGTRDTVAASVRAGRLHRGRGRRQRCPRSSSRGSPSSSFPHTLQPPAHQYASTI
jgi:pimeloyl-ACP methyl ester carboxylesterase